jgi:hypothetical protein
VELVKEEEGGVKEGGMVEDGGANGRRIAIRELEDSREL